MARIMLYVREDVKAKITNTTVGTSDLPIISVSAKKGGESSTVFTFIYREFTGAMSGLRTMDAQNERLNRILQH